ncbi:MAG: hypothetical protein H7290_19505, partial [Flavobacterium sp.]|nr:hypothetical protein [Aeromicrobium sp.]
LVFGAEDQATPASRGEEMLAARGGRGHLEVLPGVGHLTALEAPTSVAAHLLARVGRP